MTKHEMKRAYHNRMESLTRLLNNWEIGTSEFICRSDEMFAEYIAKITLPSDPDAGNGILALAEQLENLASKAESDLGMPVVLTPGSTNLIALALRELIAEVDQLNGMEERP